MSELPRRSSRTPRSIVTPAANLVLSGAATASLLVTVSVLLVASGCAPTERATDGPSATSFTNGVSGSVTRSATRSATRPRTGSAVSPEPVGSPGRSGESIAVRSADEALAPPPGVDASVLRRRSAEGPLARTTLADLLPPAPFIERKEAVPAIDPDDALRRYVRGRDALLEGRLFHAVTELEKAHESDPGSTEILRQLARALGAAGGAPRSIETYLRLLEIDPDDPEALISVALALVNQRAFEQALPPLLALQDQLEHRRERVLEELGDDAPMVISFALMTALRQTGHDRAAIEAAAAALEDDVSVASTHHAPLRSRAEEVVRQRGTAWRIVGDAWSRLGEPAQALRSYQRITNVPPTEEVGILARRLFARVQLGDHRGAADDFLAHIQVDPARVTRQEAAIAGWLARQMPDSRPLATALYRFAEAHPESPTLLWTAAGAAPPAEAAALLEAYLAERPRDLSVIAELLFELSVVRLDLAVSFAIDLVAKSPTDAEAIVERLIAVHASDRELREAFDAVAETPAREATRAWTAALLRDPGAAWTIVVAALESTPDSKLLHATRIAMAGVLEEPSRLDETVAATRDAQMWSREAAMAEVEARLRCRQWERAEGVAADLALDVPRDSDARALAAHASLMHALALPEGSALRGSAADEAIRHAMAAIEIDPSRQRAWEVVIRVHDPRSGIRPDVAQLRAMLGRLQTKDAESPLLLRLVAAEDIGRGRIEQAIERLVGLWERQPADDELIRLLLQAWARQGQLAEAERWFHAQLERSPSSPRLADALMTVLVQSGRSGEAESLLRARLNDDPDDGVAAWLLETVLRTRGSREATTLALARMERRPPGPRRDIELSALLVDAGKIDEATARLEALAGASVALTDEQIGLALATTERFDDSPRSDRLRLALAERALERPRDAPVIAHGVAIVATARLARVAPDDSALHRSIDRLIDEFAGSRAGAAEGAEAASHWALLAQRLIDADRADVATSAVRRRLVDALDQSPAMGVAIGTLAVTTDIAHGDPDAAVTTLRLIADRREHWGWPRKIATSANESGVSARDATLADVLVWASIRWSLLGEESGSKSLLRAALRLDPRHAMAKNNLGYALIEASRRAGRPPDDEATALIEGAYAALPHDPSVVDSMGWLRYLQGRIDDRDGDAGALTLLLESLELAGDDPSPEILDHCGDVLWRVGRVDEAAALWEAAEILLENEFGAERMVPRLAAMMSQEHGVVIRDPARVWQLLYGELLLRVRAKREAIAASSPPPIAPIIVGPPNAAPESRRDARPDSP